MPRIGFWCGLGFLALAGFDFLAMVITWAE
jgi:hypothetical protein